MHVLQTVLRIRRDVASVFQKIEILVTYDGAFLALYSPRRRDAAQQGVQGECFQDNHQSTGLSADALIKVCISNFSLFLVSGPRIKGGIILEEKTNVSLCERI